MSDLGLLAGLAGGLQEGVKSYQTERRYQEEKAKEEETKNAQRKLLAFQMLKEGYEETPEGTTLTPMGRRRQELENEKLESEAAKNRASARYGGVDPLDHEIKQERLSTLRKNQEEQDEKSVERLQGKLGTTQDAARAVVGLEKELGFSLDDYDPKTGKALKSSGKTGAVDLPGVSIPLVGRVGFWGDAAKLNTVASKMFNMELRDRSGAAVTTPELERLKTEFGEGKFNTEPQLIEAMQSYKNGLLAKMKDIEASNPNASQTYSDQGGSTSRGLLTSRKGLLPPKLSTTQSAPRGPIRVSDGKQTLEIDAADLADAERDGFKVIQ